MDVLNCIECFWNLPVNIGGLVGAIVGAIVGAPTAELGGVIPISGAAIGGLVTEFLAPFFTASFCSFWESLSHNIIRIFGGPVEVNAAYVDGSIEAFFDAAWKLIDNLIP